MDLERLERKLKERLKFDYNWGIKQNNEMDFKTSFVYKVYGVNKVLKILEEMKATKELKDYALNRWYNFHSASGVEYIFQQYKNVKEMKNVYHKTVDFYIEGIPFDHKTTVLPKHYKNNIEKAINNKEELIKWLYDNQSKEQRQHYKNRLFLVVYDSGKYKRHWTIKSEIKLIKNKVENYVLNFNKENLIKININGNEILSDVIFIVL